MPANTVQRTIDIWREFGAMHAIFRSHTNTMETIDKYESHAKQFKSLFVEHVPLGGGYGRANFTPYMHIVCDHFPNILRRLSDHDLRRHSGEATEASCRIARKAFKRSNHRNNSLSVMLKRWRLGLFARRMRKIRQYLFTKRKSAAPERNTCFGAKKPASSAAAPAVPMQV